MTILHFRWRMWLRGLCSRNGPRDHAPLMRKRRRKGKGDHGRMSWSVTILLLSAMGRASHYAQVECNCRNNCQNPVQRAGWTRVHISVSDPLIVPHAMLQVHLRGVSRQENGTLDISVVAVNIHAPHLVEVERERLVYIYVDW